MKNRILFSLAGLLTLCVSIGSSQISIQKPLLKPKPLLDLATIAKQRISITSLPDTQHIIGVRGAITTVGQIKQEWHAARVNAEESAKSMRTASLRNFEQYRQKFLSAQMQLRRNAEARKARLISSMKTNAPLTGTRAPQVNAATAAAMDPTPIISALDPDTGMFGVAVVIRGSKFGNRQGKVKFMVSATTWMDGGIADGCWSDSQIVAIVPDNTGNPDYNGFVVVQKPLGKKSSQVRFRITSEQDLILLSGTGATVTLNGPMENGWPPCADRNIEHRDVPTVSDIMVYHEPVNYYMNTSCWATDYLWKDLVLKNGWIVDNVVLTNLSPEGTGKTATAEVVHSVLGTTTPTLQVNWNLSTYITADGYEPPYADNYQVQVYLRGPKGVAYK